MKTGLSKHGIVALLNAWLAFSSALACGRLAESNPVWSWLHGSVRWILGTLPRGASVFDVARYPFADNDAKIAQPLIRGGVFSGAVDITISSLVMGAVMLIGYVAVVYCVDWWMWRRGVSTAVTCHPRWLGRSGASLGTPWVLALVIAVFASCTVGYGSYAWAMNQELRTGPRSPSGIGLPPLGYSRAGAALVLLGTAAACGVIVIVNSLQCRRRAIAREASTGFIPCRKCRYPLPIAAGDAQSVAQCPECGVHSDGQSVGQRPVMSKTAWAMSVSVPAAMIAAPVLLPLLARLVGPEFCGFVQRASDVPGINAAIRWMSAYP